MTIQHSLQICCAILVGVALNVLSETGSSHDALMAELTEQTGAMQSRQPNFSEISLMSNASDSPPGSKVVLDSEPSNNSHTNVENESSSQLENGTKAQNSSDLLTDANNNDTFNQHMSEAHYHVQNKEWQNAQEEISKALKIKPKSVAANELREHIQAELEHLKYKSILESFNELVQSENWVEASRLAELIEETDDPQIHPKIHRVQQLAELEQAIDNLSQVPHHLSRASTEIEMNRIKGKTATLDVGKRVSQKLIDLDASYQLWTTPVHIHLTSDRKTRIMIRPGGNLGAFKTKQIKVMPGHYVIQGRREGFREVRQEVTLEPGSGITQLTIKANERF